MVKKTFSTILWCIGILLILSTSVYSGLYLPFSGGSLIGTPHFGGQDPLPDTTTFNQELLKSAIQFYAYQRCGDANNPLLEEHELGPMCHLQDGEAVGLDLTGGWHDAGDHVKVTLTTAY